MLLTNTILGICWFDNPHIKGSLPKFKKFGFSTTVEVSKKG